MEPAHDRRGPGPDRQGDAPPPARALSGRRPPSPPCHARAERAEDTDWAQIDLLYAALERMQPSPVVTLNRAVAVIEGARAGGGAGDDRAARAASCRAISISTALKGALLQQLGRHDEARAAFDRAIAPGQHRRPRPPHIRQHLDHLDKESGRQKLRADVGRQLVVRPLVEPTRHRAGRTMTSTATADEAAIRAAIVKRAGHQRATPPGCATRQATCLAGTWSPRAGPASDARGHAALRHLAQPGRLPGAISWPRDEAFAPGLGPSAATKTTRTSSCGRAAPSACTTRRGHGRSSTTTVRTFDGRQPRAAIDLKPNPERRPPMADAQHFPPGPRRRRALSRRQQRRQGRRFLRQGASAPPDLTACRPTRRAATCTSISLVNGGSLMLADAYPEHGHPLETPGGYTLHLQVDDVDAWCKRAVEAGCEVAAAGHRHVLGRPLRPVPRPVRRALVGRHAPSRRAEP